MCKEIINIIKYVIIIIIFFFHIRNIYINNRGIKIDTDNIRQFSDFENNLDYSNYTTDIKIIALYYPNFYPTDLNNIKSKEFYSEWEIIKNSEPLYKGHTQPRTPLDMNYYNLNMPDVIEKQIDLAKSHGIYGFGIYYYWFSGKKFFEKPLEIFFENKNINFQYLLIWRNEDLIINNKIIVNQEYDENYAENFIEDIKKYLKDPRYIKNNEKPIIGIYKFENILDLKDIIIIWRKKAKESGIGEIFILGNINKENQEFLEDLASLDGLYEIPPKFLFKNNLIKNNHYYFYSGLIYENNNLEELPKNLIIYKGTMLEYDNSPKDPREVNIFDEYSPEKFYILNRLLINWTKNKFVKEDRFMFINSWNNWSEGTYLEPDQKYGYASLNALSKALFDLPFKETIYNITDLQKEVKVLIQIHIYYEELAYEIINKINIIPVNFDLYITTDTFQKQFNIEKILLSISKAKNYEIKVFENKGRDVLPYVEQLKDVIKKYKYICHLHTKKTKYDFILGEKWKNYLYNNLFGDENTISEILTDFENDNKLGIIFPETYYYIKLNVIKYNKNNIKYMNYLLQYMFKDNIYKIGSKIIFPSGNMYWARVKAIYQVFEQDIYNKCARESAQYDATMMHGIERIWLFVAKLNGYYYKTIFKYK